MTSSANDVLGVYLLAKEAGLFADAAGVDHITLPIVPLFLCCQLADIGKCIVGLIMIRRGVWIQNIVGKEAA